MREDPKNPGSHQLHGSRVQLLDSPLGCIFLQLGETKIGNEKEKICRRGRNPEGTQEALGMGTKVDTNIFHVANFLAQAQKNDVPIINPTYYSNHLASPS